MSDKRFEKFGEPEDRLIEECAELIQAISKAKRFGWNNYHPARPNSNNAKEVLNEIEDVKKCCSEMEPILNTFINNLDARQGNPHESK